MGFVVNRLNVSITGSRGPRAGGTSPPWPELVITLMLVAVGFALFGLAVKHLPVYPREEALVPMRT